MDLTHDSSDADRKVRSANYDIILLDPKLPDVDGFTLLKDWRRDGITAEVFLLTSRQNTKEIVLGLNLGADACLSRPFQVEELLARLRVSLRRRVHPKRAEHVHQVHDLDIDAAARTVKRQGKLVHLSPREFSLLEFLIQNRGKVVRRSTIESHLSIETNGRFTNIVDVHVSSLRKKIDSGFDSRLILTRWGMGYMFRP